MATGTGVGSVSRNRGSAVRLAASAGLALAISMSAMGSQPVALSPDGYWQVLDAVPQATPGQPFSRMEVFTPARLDFAAIRTALATAPMEFTAAARTGAVVLHLPTPDGRFERFRVVQTQVMAPELQAQFPDIRSYAAVGVDDPTASARLDVSPLGFRGMILSSRGQFFIDPYNLGNTEVYALVDKGLNRPTKPMTCGVTGDLALPPVGVDDLELDNFGSTLRQYRLAVATTAEYTSAVGGAANALAAVNSTANRISGIFERELAIRLQLIANNNTIIFTDTATDGFSNPFAQTMLNESPGVFFNTIGFANYDFGHVLGFGFDPNGLAGIAIIRSVCSANKGRGISILSGALGDPFDVDIVAHEMGHQLGGNHTFNNCSGSQGGPPNAAVEPGSGITIMAYAGVCPGTNLAVPSGANGASIAAFHAYNTLFEIRPYINNSTGGTCGTVINTGNTIPTVSAGLDYTIPSRTAFALTATGNDADGDALTYSWEQMNSSQSGTPAGLSGGTFVDNGDNPLFRSFAPSANPTRSMPWPVLFRINAVSIGETLPTTSRQMTFYVSARDGRGGYNTDFAFVTSVASAGPFLVTAPNTNFITWQGNSTQTVTWNVANTDLAPINCATVRIDLSTDTGLTFPVQVATGLPNTGSASITVPNIGTTSARIRVMGENNVFFDISNVNFTIQQVAVSCYADCDSSGALSPADFTCFLTKYRAGGTAADCDASGGLSPADFTCFLGKFRAGCP